MVNIHKKLFQPVFGKEKKDGGNDECNLTEYLTKRTF